ncbi:ribose 5-phosphate isomerase B [Oceanispirochaeta sp.]|jgi:ribose 5-phosphate isomerase B|uniref:ribose 5-phosphate isomerase B n=1 Tax=Oceanispirochaeta sp. TaxID=2035350 RepID=UPI002625763D|nr:ribose 5-phosphate isomerase B [Oceanispirochaeta sp.]MDA3957958.1 ribose 5-phosphate isomerase B [Oceanispirochaeta sp.]
MKKVVIANDHGAVEMKNEIVVFLKQKGYEVNDMGLAEGEAADYPDMAELACREYLKGDYEFGVVLCGTGIGISISANKIKGIRCALVQNCFAADMTKKHNNANMIAFGGRIDYPEKVTDMLNAYMTAEFEGGRHEKRVNKIMALEN